MAHSRTYRNGIILARARTLLPLRCSAVAIFDKFMINPPSIIKLSARRALEISDLNWVYIGRQERSTELFDRGVTWLRKGIYEVLLPAAIFQESTVLGRGLKIASKEEIAYHIGSIDEALPMAFAKPLSKST